MSDREPIVVTHQDGRRFAAHVGAHEITMDQPKGGGGDDSGPSPLDLIGVALGGCVALYVHKFLETRGIAEGGLRVEARGRLVVRVAMALKGRWVVVTVRRWGER